MPGSILILNSGSSSLKFALFDVDNPDEDGMRVAARGEIVGWDNEPHLLAQDDAGNVLKDQHWPAGLPDVFATVLEFLFVFADSHLGRGGLKAVGHRIVHGGSQHIAPAQVTAALLADLKALTPLDPLHMPRSIAPVHVLAAARPALLQVACFDTAFHHTLPSVARWFGLPRELEAAGIRRYGFHGLSYEYVAGRLAQNSPALAKGRVIVAHLGSGASLCALQNGRSIATTMGFSTLDGLVMATRCGSLDPGVLLYLGRQGRSFAEIEDMLYHRSGLLGVSGISGDIRTLLASEHACAREAIELFTYRIATEAGALVSALGGLDGLVFTAGIGQHAPDLRAAVCARLAWLGIRLDAGANAASADRISTSDSSIDVLVIATDEEAVIARHTRTIVDGQVA
ncbi:acetate/propionate family kinase [Rhodopila sp.]|uniref:acetate/propionate family kinase n=1 Tax=Rhodopila sp. TaxID=2480087 RepID=UPI003D12CA4F